ncbi:phosphotransferase family protein [Neobacillus niacini]|uniref:phosphotransferase family protein n=1 Tax=Neobacillus niacini TaxID=86668 RepID=UPI002040A59C|nr:phosphotransferase family protein [Neobacillus niacini]MCM3691204.1 phosphotransferase family protein [Neobacillus niacini]
MKNNHTRWIDTIPIRKGEELNITVLEDFLAENIPGLGPEPLKVDQFPSGASNLTYRLQKGKWEAVLRRPPLGPVAPKAHDMGREFKILQAVHPHFPLAPEPMLFSDNLEIVGSPFVILERKHGIVLDRTFPEHIIPTKELCRNISVKMIETLVSLHSIDYKETALTSMVKPEGFLTRQVKGWIERYERAKTDKIDGVDNLMNWLQANIPNTLESTIIHYDFKLNNTMFEHNLKEIVGLFDWEMTTVGDPLCDLAGMFVYWIEAADSDEFHDQSHSKITTMAGFMTHNELVEAYSVKSGRDIAHFNFYLTLAFFKNAVITQQIYYRYKLGQTKDERFASFNKHTEYYFKKAMKAMSNSNYRSL